MIAELRELGWRPEVLNIGEGFPRPDRADATAGAAAHLADVPKGRPIVIDGLAFGVLPEAAETLRETHPLIALVHHPLALETGVAPDEAEQLRESERAALACTRAVVVNSPATARTLVPTTTFRRTASPSRRRARIVPLRGAAKRHIDCGRVARRRRAWCRARATTC